MLTPEERRVAIAAARVFPKGHSECWQVDGKS
jgi:hypothetical protein